MCPLRPMGCAMSKCKNCHVEILDDTDICPLCRCVVEPDGLKTAEKYPNVKVREKKFALAVRIYLFLALAVEVFLVYFNASHHAGIWWSAICGGIFFYIYLVMKIGIQKNVGYRARIVFLTLFAVGLFYLIDRVMGYRGWSLNYVLPTGVIMLNVAIVLLMVVNWRNWPSYLLFQLFCILCSLLPIYLWKAGKITKPFLSELALAISILLFLGTVIIGGSKARAELQRRFHV